jgi:hypothetical protein
MPKRRLDDDDDWSEAPAHHGLMQMGVIADLRHTEPRGKPFTRQYGPLGFDITPGQTKRKRGRNVKSR